MREDVSEIEEESDVDMSADTVAICEAIVGDPRQEQLLGDCAEGTKMTEAGNLNVEDD